MREYICVKCGYKSTDVTQLLLMADGETEYCEPCYQGLSNGN